MKTDSGQANIFSFLSTPQAFGAGAGPVSRLETHISALFLCQDRVLKVKKAVRLPYLDFTTLAAREQACRAEVALNAPAAPGLYQGVCAVTRNDDGSLALDGAGEVVEWAVDMVRFDQDALLDAVARTGGLTQPLMEDLADAIAAFHGTAPPRPDAPAATAMRAIIDNNAEAFALAADGVFDADRVARLTAAQQALCGDMATVLDARRDKGRVRRCHGDMHLRNIVMWQGTPTLFDAIEFNDLFTDIDVYYDLAFLLMDLDHRGLRDLANMVMNRYADASGDADGVALLPLLLSMRAAIRAHVGGVVACHDRAACDEAQAYLAEAEGYLETPPARLIAVGGLSGSGKSGTARRLAPKLAGGMGARVVRTDATRKRLSGVGLLDRLPKESYTAAASKETYQAVYQEAKDLLEQGVNVIVDAVFAAPDERAAVAEIARRLNLPFHGLWLEAPAAVMKERAEKRIGNVSDADGRVVEAQLAYDLGEITWARVDSSGPRSETLAAAWRGLGL